MNFPCFFSRFLFVFQYFFYNGVYEADHFVFSYLDFVKFLGLEINIFNQILAIFSYYFFEYFSVTLVDRMIPFS